MDPIDCNNESVAAVRRSITEAVKSIDSSMSLHDFRMTPAGKKRTNLIFDVVVPSSVSLSHEEINRLIAEAARQINPTYCCVITFDNDFTGN